VGVGGLFTTFAALDHLPISDATVLFMTSNLIIPVLAFFFLKEHVGPYRWAAIAIGFCGVVLVAGPTGQMSFFGVFLALGAACFHASIQTLLRKLKNENAFTVTFYFILGGTLVPALAMPWYASLPDTHNSLLFVALAISGGLAQYCLTSAFKYAPATVLAPFNYTGLLWATGLDILIWSYVPGWPVFVGAAIIIGAKLYILHRERVRRNQCPRVDQDIS
jgi:drug/metabolite transporter (DMT)-like permease